MATSFVKMLRSEKAREIRRKDPLAWAFLCEVADRAWYGEGRSMDGLERGQAMFSTNNPNCGLSRQELRTRLKKLVSLQILTINSTSPFLIVSLSDSSVFDLVNDANQPTLQPTANQRATNEQPTANQRATTNIEEIEEKKGLEEEKYAALSGEIEKLGLGDLWKEILVLRKKKKASDTLVTKRHVLENLLRRPADARSAMEMWIRSSWAGFEWAWYDRNNSANGSNGNGNGHHKPARRDAL